MTTVFVSGLEFRAHHGVTEVERRIGHPVRLDIRAEVQDEARVTDDITDTVDYAALAHAATELLLKAPCHTLERAIELTGPELLAGFPRIHSLTLRIAKLAPPIGVTAREAGVERTFSSALKVDVGNA